MGLKLAQKMSFDNGSSGQYRLKVFHGLFLALLNFLFLTDKLMRVQIHAVQLDQQHKWFTTFLEHGLEPFVNWSSEAHSISIPQGWFKDLNLFLIFMKQEHFLLIESLFRKSYKPYIHTVFIQLQIPQTLVYTSMHECFKDIYYILKLRHI